MCSLSVILCAYGLKIALRVKYCTILLLSDNQISG